MLGVGSPFDAEAHLQVIRIMLPICMKAALDGTFIF
jgi:hypothetical protein